MATPTKTHKAKIQKIVNDIEAQAVAEAEAHAADATALADELAKAESSLEDVLNLPKELLSAAKRGEDVSPSALTDARTAADIAQARVTGLRQRVASAARTAMPQDATGAEMLARSVVATAKGVPVITAAAPAAKVADAMKGQEGPAIILCQEAPTVRNRDGFGTAARIGDI